MSVCAYCDQDKFLVREDLIPAWFYQHEPAWDEPQRARGWTVRSDLQAEDVCSECHDRLVAPDRYMWQLFREQLVRYLYRDTEQGFQPDYAMLVRWLLRKSYDAARLHGEELGILAQYRDVMTGLAPVPPHLQLWLRTITPSALVDGSFLAPGNATAIAKHPDWLRIGVLGVDNFGCEALAFRQVTINSYSFVLCLPDPTRLEDAHAERVEESEAIDSELVGTAWLGPGSNIWTPAPWADALTYTVQSVGCFHLGCELVESPVVAAAMGPDAAAVVCGIQRKDVEAADISNVLAVLYELLATKETCAQMQQRLEVIIVGYEDDPRPPYEIPELVTFLRALDHAFPYWMYFQHPDGRWLKLLSLLLANPARDDAGKVRVDPQRMGDTVRKWFGGLGDLCYFFGIDEDTNRRLSERAQALLLPG